jgi:predicted AAA+ superfamily ATPase
MDSSDLSFILEEYFRQYPGLRDTQELTFFLDEIQRVPDWEAFVRRVLDSERIRIFISGSSAAMLSREVATSMRGRAMDVPVYPFSFREALDHRGMLPDKEWDRLPKARRSALTKALYDYLLEGGFPEAQGIEPRDRRPLLQGYVDVVVLRDVIERHRVSNPVALRWLQRHLMCNAAAPFSIQKFYASLKSQGVPVAKDSLHAFLSYFEDAFLIRTTSLLAASERQRMVSPRRAYPIDPGLIPIYEFSGRANLGHALETAALVELLRRGCDVHYYRTPKHGEVDFHVTTPAGDVLLIQVCVDATDPDAFARETRSLKESQKTLPAARRLLLLLQPLPPGTEVPEGIEVVSAIQWFLCPHE